MPMFMDVHHGLGDATPEEIEAAHRADLAIQDAFGVRWVSYWLNAPDGKSFCLAEAPDSESLKACHRASHGLMPHNVIELDALTMAAFLGPIDTDKGDRVLLEDGKLDTGLRAIMFTDIEGSTSISTEHGDDAAVEAVRRHDEIVRRCLDEFSGSEVKHTGDGIIASFTSVTKALRAAAGIHRASADNENLRIKMGISAGEPVEESSDIYGAAVNLAARICAHAAGGQTLVAGTVRDLVIGKGFGFSDIGETELKGFPEPVRLFSVQP
jgi:class 3 adenylate cyclase